MIERKAYKHKETTKQQQQQQQQQQQHSTTIQQYTAKQINPQRTEYIKESRQK